MKPEEMRIAIAEACGWIEQGDGFWRRPDGQTVERCPDYPNDLNALHEAEKTLQGITVDVRSLYYDYLALAVPQWPDRKDETFEHEYSMVTATAAQRAEAFLRTLGKWKD